MGLLSKAVLGSSGVERPVSRGGLLKRISRKTSGNAKGGSDGSAKNKPDILFLPLEKAVMEKLSAAFAKFGAFRGTIIKADSSSDEAFTGRLAYMVSGFGMAQGLSPKRCLVLFDSSEDGGLIAEHLSKTLPGTVVKSFEAKDPEEAFPLIKPYL